jgi:hypothetical protein
MWSKNKFLDSGKYFISTTFLVTRAKNPLRTCVFTFKNVKRYLWNFSRFSDFFAILIDFLCTVAQEKYRLLE